LLNKGYSDRFIDELKQKCDIVSVISRFVTLEKKGKTYWACCPFHYEKTPSFAVNEGEQYYHCYGCGESGDVIKFIEKYESLTFVEAVKYLADSVGLKLPELNQTSQDIKQMKLKQDVLNACKLATNFYKNALKTPNAKVARDYLQKRQLGEDIVEYFNIGYSPDWNSLVNYLSKNGVSDYVMKSAGLTEVSESGRTYDVFGQRLIFPILNVYGDTIGYTARTLDPNSKFAKYKNSTQTIVFDKSKTIYNINSIKQLKKEQKIDYIIICEGTIDVIAMYKAGFKNTVACMGTAITSYHATTLKRFTDKIILCLDGDDAGQNATYKAIDVLYDQGLEVKVVKLKENLDPDEFLKKYGKEELSSCLNKAIDAIEYKLLSLANRYNLQDSYQKNKYIQNALEIVDKLDSNSQKEIYLKVISQKVNISIDVLRRDLLGNNATNTQPPPQNTTLEEQTPLVVRQEGYLKAVQFVLASIVHKQDYALKNYSLPIKFKNPSYQKLYDYVKSFYDQNKTYTISSLFDVFDVDENEDIKQIINFNFDNYENKPVYFNQCLEKLILLDLNKKQQELTDLFKSEKDLTRRREIAQELYVVTKEIKSKTEKKI